MFSAKNVDNHMADCGAQTADSPLEQENVR
jgi:hypothetical protein